MSKPLKIAFFIFLTLLPVVIVVGYGLWQQSARTSTKSTGQYKEVFWQRLRELDYETGQRSKDLAALDGAEVQIPGFVVPLEDEDQKMSEFLLVPSPTACIHVPPPPPNQMVMVRMKSGNAPKREWGPVWVKGVLRIETSKSGFGKVSYLLLADTTEPYAAQ